MNHFKNKTASTFKQNYQTALLEAFFEKELINAVICYEGDF